ncbi:MAG TPA: hypothetical protein VMH30_10220 [Verrucomicrobiae bacterium]|nr:hypothetical protein [Verrucomicrobiae bacterium]
MEKEKAAEGRWSWQLMEEMANAVAATGRRRPWIYARPGQKMMEIPLKIVKNID